MSTAAISFTPLREEATPASESRPSTSKNEMVVPGWLKLVCAFLTVGVIINMVLMSMVLFELRHGRQSVEEAHKSVSKLTTKGQKLFTLADEADRFLHGSLPDLTLDLLQSDWTGLGRQVAATASSVQGAAQKAGLNGVAQYSALVGSVGEVISQYSPEFIVPAPQPNDDAGVLNTLSYLESWINQQVDATKWGWVASNCTAFIQAAFQVNWQAEYSWYDNQQGYESSAWNANSARSTVSSVLQYCQALENINGPTPTTDKVEEKKAVHKVHPINKLKSQN